MSGLLVLRALLFAGECLAVSVALPLLAFAATALLRRRAALRHLVWTTMFGVLAVLPIVALLLPARQVVQHVPAPQAVPPAAPVLVDAPAALVAAAPPSPLLDLATPENLVLLLVALWLAGLCWQALRLGLGGLGLMRLRRRSASFAMELETRCDVRLARDETGPSTFGILRPVVLLPRSAQGWPAARLEAVLRHEAAHVARRDVAAQFVARLVCALYWINPLLWLAYRALRREAEIAADDAVLAGGMTPSIYATELVRLAAHARGVTPGIAMAGPPLTKRVEAVLAENSSRKGVSRMDIAKTVSFGLVATLLLGVARFDLAVAQDAPAPKVERNVERNVEKGMAIEARAKAEAAEIKAITDAVVAKARAKAAAETDPAKKQQYRKEAENLAAEGRRTQADAERMAAGARMRAVNAVRANDDVQRAVEAQAAAVKAQADINVAHARAVAAAQTDPVQKDVFRRIAEDKAAEAAVTKADADLAVAHAREAARARAEADMRPARPNVDFGFRYQPDGFELDPAVAQAMQKPEVRRAIDEAVRTAMLEARKAINAAIAKATGQSTPALIERGTYSYDLPAPDGWAPPAPPAPPSARAIPAPPAPPAPPRPLK